MEEKTDKVVGYIEYLGAGGMIGEIVPYTSVEKFKDGQQPYPIQQPPTQGY